MNNMKIPKINWEKIYTKNIAKWIAICYRYTSDKAIAEDLAHDAFLKAYEKRADYNGKGLIEAWITRIVINDSLQFLRNQKPALNFEESESKTLQNNDWTDSEEIEWNYTISELLDAINQLVIHHRTVFNLYVLDQWSHQQISNKLGISVGTSKSHLSRARKKLRTILVEQNAGYKKTKRASLLFVFFNGKASIDNVFYKKLKSFKIKTTKDFSSFSNSLISSKSSLSFAAGWTAKTAFIVLLSAGCVSAFIALNKKTNNKVSTSVDINVDSIANQAKILPDSILVDSIDSVQNTNGFVLDSTPTKTQPVVIRKKIIKRKKVIIKRKTPNDTTP